LRKERENYYWREHKLTRREGHNTSRANARKGTKDINA